MQITQKPVKNFTAGRKGYKPEAVVIHIAEGTLAGGHAWFNNPTSQASAHYMIGKSGAIWQFVKEADSAWHAGGVANPNWKYLKPGINPNLYTIGIEHEGFHTEKWSEQMYQATGWLIAQIANRWNLKVDRDHIVGHYQINSISRKSCPGSNVDFAKIIKIAQSNLEDPAMIKELQTQIAALKTTQAQLTTQVSQLELTNAALVAENQRLKQTSNNETLIKDNNALREEVYKLQQKVQQLSNEIIELRKPSSGTTLDNRTTGELFTALVKKIIP